MNKQIDSVAIARILYTALGLVLYGVIPLCAMYLASSIAISQPADLPLSFTGLVDLLFLTSAMALGEGLLIVRPSVFKSPFKASTPDELHFAGRVFYALTAVATLCGFGLILAVSTLEREVDSCEGKLGHAREFIEVQREVTRDLQSMCD